MSELPKAVEKRFYVLEQLEDAAQSMGLIADVLPIYRQKVAELLPTDKQRAQNIFDQLTAERDNLTRQLRAIRPYLVEVEEIPLAEAAGALAAQLATFNLLTPDYTKLSAVLGAFIERIPTGRKATGAVIGHLMNNVRLGHYPTDLQNVAHIARGIAFPDGVTVNLLDPCCGTGAALKKLGVGSDCITYGVELDQSRAEKAQDVLHRVGFGSYFHARISHEAFHAAFLNPPYLSVLTENGGRTRDEKRFLIESIPRLMVGGLLAFIVPYYRMTDDICRIFCDNFTDVAAYRFTDSEFPKFKQIAVLGLRRAKTDGSEEAEKLSALCYKPMELPCVSEIPEGRYALPATAKDVELFKGAEFNVMELARQLSVSDSLQRMFVKKKLETAKRHPPLPLSIGQVGLIGGSGLINGLMDCDCPHVIKGRIVKVKRTSSEENFDNRGRHLSTEIRETISNKMVFNILTPNGCKVLA